MGLKLKCTVFQMKAEANSREPDTKKLVCSGSPAKIKPDYPSNRKNVPFSLRNELMRNTDHHIELNKILS